MRYKEFNPNVVLEKCIPIFWKIGYRGTSINDVVKATGVNRFSLYEEFENKDGLLLAALRLYNERYFWNHVQILNQSGDVKTLLEKFYLSFLHGQELEGCFVVHVGIELADTHKGVKLFLEEYIEKVESHIVQLLQREYPKEEAIFYARHLVGLFYTSMSFCLIKSDKYRAHYIRNSIHVILNKKLEYA